MTPIKISFEAETPEQLRTILSTYMQAMGGDASRVTTLTNPTPTTAEVEVSPAADPTTTATQPYATDEKAPNVVSDLTPEQARTQAIKTAQKFYSENPNALPQIAKLQQKFGIKMFSEVSDDRAHDLLADILLVANGTPAGEA